MKKISISIFVLCALALGGCSSFSKESRQQRAYARYVAKSSKGKVKLAKMFRHSGPQIPPMPPVSEPVENTSVGDAGPQAMPSESASSPSSL